MSTAEIDDPTTLDDRERDEWLRSRIVQIDQEIHGLDEKARPISAAKRELNKEKSKLLQELRFAENGSRLEEDDE
jgi:hypothetical protein